MKYVSYGRQCIDAGDLRAVEEALKSDLITQGPLVEKFEKGIARFCGAKYAVAVSSGTAALHTACLAAGLKKGDKAVTSPMTFLATANSVLYAGARPVFADIDYATSNIDPEKVKRRITKNTKAILPVDFAGLPCDIREISRIARNRGITVIEDGCHALGASYLSGKRWTRIGSCAHSDMTVFSFHPVKHITTGEGGAITTNNMKIYRKLLALRSHGTYKTPSMARTKGPWYYEMRDLGFNYRITDFQCALGLSQIGKLNGYVNRRRRIAAMYDKAFKGIEHVETPHVPEGKRHAYHLYVLKVDFRRLGINRRSFMKKLREKGILCQVHYIPLYRQPYYRNLSAGNYGDFASSEKYYERAVSLPIYPSMSDADVKSVISNVKGMVS